MHVQGSTEPNYFPLLIQVADARIAARPPQLVPRHLTISRPTIRSHGGSRSSCTILPKIFIPLQTPRERGNASAPAPATALSGTDKRSSVRLAHYHSIQSTSLRHACRACHHHACGLNSPSHHLLLREPKRSFRPQMTLWFSDPRH